MQALRCLFITLFVLIWVTNAQNTTVNEALSLIQKMMPACGAWSDLSSCLLSGIANSTCDAGDIPCTCNNKDLDDAVTACVLKSCTVKQQLTTKNTTETICQRPFRDGRKAGWRSIVVGLCFSVVAFALRIVSKISSPCGGHNGWTHNLWWDDAVMSVAMLLVLFVSYAAIPCASRSSSLYRTKLLICVSKPEWARNRMIPCATADHGLLIDVWTVPFPNITRMLKIFYWVEDAYLIALPLIKVSLLTTYLRVFPSERFRTACFVVIGLHGAYIIAFVLVSLFQCRPISLAWEHWHREIPGHCNNINAQIWAASTTNMVLDIVTLGLPMPVLWNLQLNSRSKFWLMVMFGVGFFVTIVSIIRLRVLVVFGDSRNLTWDYTSIGYWSAVELHTSVVCACMPSLRNLLRKFMPYVMGMSTGRTGGVSDPTSHTTGKSAFTTTEGLGDKFPRRTVMIRSVEGDEENIIPLHELQYSSRNKTEPLPRER
ncbi:putative integral membrane protein [Teratosphaeria destructans]|uniref:Integral membrane protein n=1 Tax=Teratosphaeria destructans TaxID=418781 RepID=A0A9W7SSI6_9PEZI|nr:putative integral membrane protein [Teratosphaeria destructans]